MQKSKLNPRRRLLTRVSRMRNAGMSLRHVGKELGKALGTVYDMEEGKSRKYANHMFCWPEFVRDREPMGDGKYILTSAQTGVAVHEGFWRNLKAYAKHIKAKIVVGIPKTYADEDMDECLKGYVSETTHEISDGIMWMGGVEISPTARSPEVGVGCPATDVDCIIVPHSTVRMQVVGSTRDFRPRFVYSSGSITPPVPRRGGNTKQTFIAQAEWQPSALILEVDGRRRKMSGSKHWVRQLVGDDEGELHDLDNAIYQGKVYKHVAPNVMVSGDLHLAYHSCDIFESLYGQGGLLPYLEPHYHFMHDVFDGASVNRHEKDDHLKNFGNLTDYSGPNSMTVREELEWTAKTLNRIQASTEHLRPATAHFVVEGNHDRWLYNWAKSHDVRRDTHDLIEWHMVNLDFLRAYAELHGKTPTISHTLERHGLNDMVGWLRDGEGMEVKGVEYSCHGDRGPGGARGSVSSFGRLSHPITVGHAHTPAIKGNCYQVGICADMDMPYARGPSNWAASCALGYANGSRAIITMEDGRWFMGQNREAKKRKSRKNEIW